jgi:tetratricopeptide (TPR) repeat protein
MSWYTKIVNTLAPVKTQDQFETIMKLGRERLAKLDLSSAESFERALSFRPGDYDGNLLAGIAHYCAWKLGPAQASFGRAFLSNPNDPAAHLGLALVALDMGERAEADAVDSLRKCCSLASAQSVHHFFLGVAAAKIGQWAQAASAYESAIRLDSSFVEAYHNLGWIHSKLNDLDAAHEDHQHALALCSDFIPAIVGIGRTLAQKGLRQEAGATFSSALSRIQVHLGFPNRFRRIAYVLSQTGSSGAFEAHIFLALSRAKCKDEANHLIGIAMNKIAAIRRHERFLIYPQLLETIDQPSTREAQETTFPEISQSMQRLFRALDTHRERIVEALVRWE